MRGRMLIPRFRFRSARMKIKSSPRRKLRHLAFRFASLATETNQWVSAPYPHDWARCSYEYLFLSRQRRTPVTLVRRLSQRRHPGVCADLFFAFAHIHHVQIAETARRNALIGDVREDEEKFGPLKVVLGAIPAAYENHEVR